MKVFKTDTKKNTFKTLEAKKYMKHGFAKC